MFSIANFPKFKPFQKLDIDEKAINIPQLIEGDKELDALCPVNHLTGSRENPLNLIGLILSDSKRHLLEKFLEEVPSSKEFQGLDDNAQLEFVCDYLSCGMPAEKDQLLSILRRLLMWPCLLSVRLWFSVLRALIRRLILPLLMILVLKLNSYGNTSCD